MNKQLYNIKKIASMKKEAGKLTGIAKFLAPLTSFSNRVVDSALSNSSLARNLYGNASLVKNKAMLAALNKLAPGALDNMIAHNGKNFISMPKTPFGQYVLQRKLHHTMKDQDKYNKLLDSFDSLL